MAYPTDPIYKFVKDIMTDKIVAVKTQTGNLVNIIPLRDDNTDYQEYLEWAKTNTAEEAD